MLLPHSYRKNAVRTLAIASHISSTLCAVALLGCGGGGGSTTPTPTTQPTTSSSKCTHTFSAASSSFTLANMRAGTFGLHPAPVAREESIPGRLAVRFTGALVPREATAILARLGARLISPVNSEGAASYSLPAGVDVEVAASRLSSVPGVVAAGPVILRHLLTVPDDTDFNNVQQWDMYAISMPSAWGITTGTVNVRIAIIDTGYDLGNPDLTGKVPAGGSIVYDLGTGLQDTKTTVQDKDGHGSDVSGIAAADTNNATNVAGVGWNPSGVGWNVQLLEARVFPYGGNGANTEDIAAAINWAVANSANVINLSLGGATADNMFEEPAVANAIAAGVVVVAAAGNDGMNTIDYPAHDPGAIAVGASAYCDSVKNAPGSGFEYVAGYSNYGSQLSVVAPGGDPDATQQNCTTVGCVDFLQWIENLDSTQGQFKEQVGLFAGTSQATPHVSGAVALMVATADANGQVLTPTQALTIIKASADNISDTHQGSGRLDVFRALQQTP